MSTSPVIEKYIARYCEPLANDLARLTLALLPAEKVYHNCLLVPAFDEVDLHRIWQAITGQSQLILILLNAPHTASQAAVSRTKAVTNQLAAQYKQLAHCQSTQARLPLFAIEQARIITIELTESLPPGQGIGLARKLLADLTIQLWQQARLASMWFVMTDSDAILPAQFWSELNCLTPSGPGLAVLPVVHATNDPSLLSHATKLYELWLRQYTQALGQAIPRYALTPLGSRFMIHVQTYCQVRGFPKRCAGEDFYFLNKCLLHAKVYPMSGPLITLRARLSKRTPFGTGPGVAKLLEQVVDCGELAAVPLFYQPACLRRWQQHLIDIRQEMLQGSVQVLAQLCQRYALLSPKQLTALVAQLHQRGTVSQRLQLFYQTIDLLRCIQLLNRLHLGLLTYNQLHAELGSETINTLKTTWF